MNIRTLRITLAAQTLLIAWLALPPAAMAAFTDNGNGTVTDTVTGLMWDRCSQGQSGTGCATGAAGTMTWPAALTAAVTANTANYKGYNDWRLPNKNELESLVDLSSAANPAINPTAFPATPASSVYWSSTTYTPYPAYAWYVVFYGGDTVANYKTGNYAVRLVRSGQLIDAFDAQGDTTPDAFAFTAQTGVALSTVITSNTITVAGINTASAITIVSGAYSINGGAYTAVAGTVNNGNTVTVRQTSSASYSTLTTATLTIGGVSGAFNVTTLAAPPPPPPDPAPPDPALVYLLVNGGIGYEFSVANPVAVTYQLRGCQDKEMFLVLNAPPMGIVWSYRNAAGQWVKLPVNLADITPFSATGPGDGTYPLFTGAAPLGDYELYLGCDFAKNGHLDYVLGWVDGVYAHIIVHVR